MPFKNKRKLEHSSEQLSSHPRKKIASGSADGDLDQDAETGVEMKAREQLREHVSKDNEHMGYGKEEDEEEIGRTSRLGALGARLREEFLYRPGW